MSHDHRNIQDFRKERAELMDTMVSMADRNMKRFLALDSGVYEDGALSIKTKELLGLVASTVLRCDDCINYHLDTCSAEGVTDGELIEAMDIALVVGGSITIPHVRRALSMWKDIRR
ncbi:MAG: carboxymuconolactone decarboxylase family protein [Thermoplasmatota archaeon]